METGLIQWIHLDANITQIHYHFGLEFCKALPMFHAFTNSDFSTSLNWKSKVRPPQLIEEHESVQQVFPKFNEWDTITDDNWVLGGSVCTAYEKRDFDLSVNCLLNWYSRCTRHTIIPSLLKKLKTFSSQSTFTKRKTQISPC